MPSYKDRVNEQKKWNPSLHNLCEFLNDTSSKPEDSSTGPNIGFIQFNHNDSGKRKFESSSIEELTKWLSTIKEPPNQTNDTKTSLGRLLFVEDLNREVIELIGSKADIDPFFFASHLDGVSLEIDYPRPSTVILPSIARDQNYITLQYQKALEFSNEKVDKSVQDYDKLNRNCILPRKLTILPETKKKKLGLAQYCCSICLKAIKEDFWLGIILVDPPDECIYKGKGKDRELLFKSKPFQGGHDVFLRQDLYNEVEVLAGSQNRHSMLNILKIYWCNNIQSQFRPESPSLLSLSYFSLKVVAGEWVTYVEALSHQIKQHEHSGDALSHNHGIDARHKSKKNSRNGSSQHNGVNTQQQHKHLGHTEHSQDTSSKKQPKQTRDTRSQKIDTVSQLQFDLVHLEKWGRRCIQTIPKLETAIRFVHSRSIAEKSPTDQEVYNLIEEDYKHLVARLPKFKLQTLGDL
ncbi:hypothetical protein BP6252_06546 [Coleophoma cylindrospora]|uniref:Uncharacterized protein n=1 Tax=Coleophoma cylindrospora TaxID=1849047 RepID=A0A3D8RND5_9HELO|nr:hypothetical protein BP6252_06546 [Coleophoma cylindrospora]